jgi:hypothetical protein
MTLKESAIRDYISKIDFKSEEWGLSTIKQDMKRFLGEEPGIDITYKKDVMINETTGKPQEFLDIDRIKIVFYDLDEKFKKIEFLIGK